MLIRESTPRPSLVLYIEDNLTNLALVEQLLLRRDDVILISSLTGRAGIALAGERRPAVILMDIHLPDMSGLEAMAVLRAGAATAHIPVIALSSDAYPRQIADGMAAGFCRYLTKPFTFADFTAALDACLAAGAVRPPHPVSNDACQHVRAARQ